MSGEITAALDVQDRLDAANERSDRLALDLAECEAALTEQRAANKRIGAELAEARGRIAKLEAQLMAAKCMAAKCTVDTYKRGFASANDALRFAVLRFEQLEAQYEGKLYAQGCAPE